MKPIRTLSPHSFGLILIPSHLHPGVPKRSLLLRFFTSKLCINLSRLSCVLYLQPPYPSWCDQMWKWGSVNLGTRAFKNCEAIYWLTYRWGHFWLHPNIWSVFCPNRIIAPFLTTSLKPVRTGSGSLTTGQQLYFMPHRSTPVLLYFCCS